MAHSTTDFGHEPQKMHFTHWHKLSRCFELYARTHFGPLYSACRYFENTQKHGYWGDLDGWSDLILHGWEIPTWLGYRHCMQVKKIRCPKRSVWQMQTPITLLSRILSSRCLGVFRGDGFSPQINAFLFWKSKTVRKHDQIQYVQLYTPK